MAADHLTIVGAGLSGATIARLAAEDGIKVTVYEKRDHVGGNCYDYIDASTGVRMCKYGAHLFHTNDKGVWDFVNRFSEWKRWDHEVRALIPGVGLVPVPPNRTTMNMVSKDVFLKTDEEAEAFLAKERRVLDHPPTNSEEMALSRVGRDLYEAMFRDYTIKQWNKHPSELDASVLARIPARVNTDPRYFSDRYQALPAHGYTTLVTNMLDHPNITVHLNTSFKGANNPVVYTGRIDQYFDHPDIGALEYRTLEFKHIYFPHYSGYMQPYAVVNRPSLDVPYTRTVEHKHFLHQQSKGTVITYEQSMDYDPANPFMEPYYPVPTPENTSKYEKYQQLAKDEKGVHFVGRLANYKYFNMDEAIRNAMDYYAKHLSK